ncbi:MAG: hypothetical protein VKJ04_08540 [Vampirovibrionales bacterium]|nr:hypothetical protein [Vampirovibrionales bacterium]
MATRLPAGVLNYVHQKDPKVQVRFDGVVIFSNGNTYLPIIPQDPSARPDAIQVVATTPEKVDYPELIQFDNNFFLIKILQTSAGRLTLPRLANVPIQLKEGLLPQDLVMPNHLFIPDELKVILGELPYDPSLKNAVPKESVAQTLKKLTPPGASKASDTSNKAGTNPNQRLLYAYDMDKQLLSRVDVLSKKIQATISLGCMPASMVSSPDGKYLYAGCLSSNEVVVVDLAANLIKTRVGVGSKPQDLLLLPDVGYLVVGNRFEQTLDLINTHDLLPATKEFKIDLPGRPGPMAAISERQILVADAYKNQIYQYDLSNRQLERTINTLPDVSALWIERIENANPRLWVTSRSEGKVQVLDLPSAKPIATVAVGSKPIAIQSAKFNPAEQRASQPAITNEMMAAAPSKSDSKKENEVVPGAAAGSAKTEVTPEAQNLLKDQVRVYVLCAGDDRIDIIDADKLRLSSSINLSPGMFPTAMVIPAAEKLAYIGGAGQDGIAVVDLIQNQPLETVSVPFRTFSLTMAIPLQFASSGEEKALEHAPTISPLERSQMAGGLLEKPPSEQSEAKAVETSNQSPAYKNQDNPPQDNPPMVISPALMQSNLSVPAPQQGGGFQWKKQKAITDENGEPSPASSRLAKFFNKKKKTDADVKLESSEPVKTQSSVKFKPSAAKEIADPPELPMLE